MKSLDVKSSLSALAGKLFYLFSKKPFCTWGIFSFLLWEVASSFPKSIPHLLFKQGALEEHWSLNRAAGVVKSFDALMHAGMLAVCRQKSQSLPGLGLGVGWGEGRLSEKQELGSLKRIQLVHVVRGLSLFWTGVPSGICPVPSVF